MVRARGNIGEDKEVVKNGLRRKMGEGFITY